MKNIIHPNAWVHKGAEFEAPVHFSSCTSIYNKTTIGAYTFLNVNTVIYPNVRMGRYCSTGRFVEIGAARHPMHFLSTHLFQITPGMFPNSTTYNEVRHVSFETHPATTIGNDVWIGAKAVIVAGAKIGNGAVIGANSVVSKDIPPYAIVSGSPAKIIRYRFNKRIINLLQKTKWWDMSLEKIKDLPFNDIEKSLEILKKDLIDDNKINQKIKSR